MYMPLLKLNTDPRLLAEVTAYPQPAAADGVAPIALYPDFSVTANGEPIPVLTADVCSGKKFATWAQTQITQCGFCHFDKTDGVVTIQVVVSNRSVTSFELLPARYADTATQTGNVITFDVTVARPYRLIINGDAERCLDIFVDPPLELAGRPDPASPTTQVIAPGIHATPWDTTKSAYIFLPGVHRLGAGNANWPVGSDRTVWLDGGAHVYGRLVSSNTLGVPNNGTVKAAQQNITIKGRGIIDTSLCVNHSGSPIYLCDTTNIRIEGIIVNRSCGFTVLLGHCRDFVVERVKVFGAQQNTDGFDSYAAQRGAYRWCYQRTWDDGSSLKSSGAANSKIPHFSLLTDPDEHNVLDITYEDCTFGGDLGIGAVVVGEEAECAAYQRIKYYRTDFFSPAYQGILNIQIADTAAVSDVLWEDVWIHNARAMSAGMRWIWISGTGTVSNVTGRRITISGPIANKCEITGTVDGVRFEDLVINGTKVTPSNCQTYFTIGAGVQNVTFA